jgi:hypothetical protein
MTKLRVGKRYVLSQLAKTREENDFGKYFSVIDPNFNEYKYITIIEINTEGVENSEFFIEIKIKESEATFTVHDKELDEYNEKVIDEEEYNRLLL